MVKKIISIVISAIGMLVGYGVADLLGSTEILVIDSSILDIVFRGVVMVIFAVLFYLIAPWVIRRIERLVDGLETLVINQPKESLLLGLSGLIIGIIIAFLLSYPLTLIDLPPVFEIVKVLVSVMLYVTFATLGYRLAIGNKNDVTKFFSRLRTKDNVEKSYEKTVTDNKGEVSSKLLDTSVIIDGRIKQIVESGFLEGELIVPNFVLFELQTIADSADDSKRERGRRGLDIVKELQNSPRVNVKISKKDFKDLTEVDTKLLRYANETGFSIITNDYNLNKLAQVQAIKVLNINELANAVKTIVIPGEKMLVNIIKEGKEKRQGLAYLDDGTMIVVEEGKNLIGSEVAVTVSTVLQTAAGKMIFAKIEE